MAYLNSKIVLACMAGLAILSTASTHAAVMLNPGFEGLTGSDPAHFSSGLLLDGHASASANPLSNPNVYVTPDPAPGWHVDTSAGGTTNPTLAQMPDGPLEGQNVGYSNGSILSQDFADDVLPSMTYTFSIGVGRPAFVTGDFAYKVFLSIPTGVVAEDANTLTLAPGQWDVSTVSWTSPAVVAPGTKLTLNLAADHGVAYFDDADSSSAAAGIPEPASLSFLGLLSLARRARRL